MATLALPVALRTERGDVRVKVAALTLCLCLGHLSAFFVPCVPNVTGSCGHRYCQSGVWSFGGCR